MAISELAIGKNSPRFACQWHRIVCQWHENPKFFSAKQSQWQDFVMPLAKFFASGIFLLSFVPLAIVFVFENFFFLDVVFKDFGITPSW